jgi:Ribonuclease G/E
VPLKVYLRGIYSTALTKILLDEGFEISYPSNPILARFKVRNLNVKPDAVIIETSDKQGVLVKGPSEKAEKLVRVIVERLKYVILRKSIVAVGSVYKGLIVGNVNGNALINLGSFKGLLRNIGNLKNGDEVLVQTVQPIWKADELAPLRSNIVIDGFYMGLTQNGTVTFDDSLRKSPRFREILNLSSILRRDGWGIRWKSTAAKAPLEELIGEFEELKGKVKLVRKDSLQSSGPLLEGESVYRLDFPCKNLLDELRSTVVPTVKGHHVYRCFREFGAAVDLAELMLARGADKSFVEDCLDRFIGFKSIEVGSRLEFEHRKLDGTILNLNPGVVEAVDSDFLTVRRRISGSGFYDGLGVAKEPGDYALTRFKPGGWLIEHMYFSSRGEFKGIYVNINTPVEVVKGLVRYVDLAVDVSAKPGEEPKVLDMDELEEFYEKGVVQEPIFSSALKALEEAKLRASTIQSGELNKPYSST